MTKISHIYKFFFLLFTFFYAYQAVAQDYDVLYQELFGAAPVRRFIAVDVTIVLDGYTSFSGQVKVSDSSAEIVFFSESLQAELLQILDPQRVNDLKKYTTGDGTISSKELQTLGFTAQYNQRYLTVNLDSPPEWRKKTTVDLSFSSQRNKNKSKYKLAKLSGFMNIEGSHYLLGGNQSQSLGLKGVVNWDGWVTKTEASMSNQAPSIDSVSLIKDNLQMATRRHWGDLSYTSLGFQVGEDVFGFSENKEWNLQPEALDKNNSEYILHLKKRAEVRIVVNGHVVRSLDLPSGKIELKNFPLESGYNLIEMKIKAKDEEMRIESFERLWDAELLPEGESDYSMFFGLPLTYPFSVDARGDLRGGFFKQLGVAEELTGGWYIQKAKNHVLAGTEWLKATNWGLAVVDLGMSGFSPWGTDAALKFRLSSYDRSFRISDKPSLQSQVSVQYQGKNFMTDSPNNKQTAWQIEPSIQMSLKDVDQIRLGTSVANNWDGEGSNSTSLTYTKIMGPLQVQTEFRHSVDTANNPDWSLGFRVTGRWDKISSTFIQKQRQDRDARWEGEWSYRDPFGDATQRLRVSSEGKRQRVQVATEMQRLRASATSESLANGSSAGSELVYRGSRGIVRSKIKSASVSGTDTQEAVVQLESAIAFADGHWAVGRPIQNGFAIVIPHPSISNYEMQFEPYAKIDKFGPALFSDLASYRMNSLLLRESNLPVGVDVGSSKIYVNPGHFGGVKVTLGHGGTILLSGTLIDTSENPLVYRMGSLTAQHEEGQKSFDIFTNKKGKFQAQGISPGTYSIDIYGPIPLKGIVVIPEHTEGFFSVGTILVEEEK